MVKPLVKENAIERELLTRVRALGGVAEKVTVLGTRGFFDRLVILPGGRVIFVEVKKPSGGRVSAHQMMKHTRYRLLGAEVVVVSNSGDIDRLLSSG